MKLLFDINLAGVLDGEQVDAHPGEFASAHAGLGNVDGGAGEVRANDVALCVGGVAVRSHQVLLVVNGAHSGIDHERSVELGLVGARKVRKKRRGPGTAIATVLRKFAIDGESRGLGNRHEYSAGDAVREIGIVFDAFQRVSLGAFILADERIAGSAQGRDKHHPWPMQRGDGTG